MLRGRYTRRCRRRRARKGYGVGNCDEDRAKRNAGGSHGRTGGRRKRGRTSGQGRSNYGWRNGEGSGSWRGEGGREGGIRNAKRETRKWSSEAQGSTGGSRNWEPERRKRRKRGRGRSQINESKQASERGPSHSLV